MNRPQHPLEQNKEHSVLRTILRKYQNEVIIHDDSVVDDIKNVIEHLNSQIFNPNCNWSNEFKTLISQSVSDIIHKSDYSKSLDVIERLANSHKARFKREHKSKDLARSIEYSTLYKSIHLYYSNKKES